MVCGGLLRLSIRYHICFCYHGGDVLDGDGDLKPGHEKRLRFASDSV